MRPDRIIVGEVRGAEALDMLQAMNTGHDGSLCTVHANSPRDALSRIETMVLMAGYDLPVRAIRQQVASALDLIVHLERLQDGSRRVTAITEVQRMESDVITLQDLFEFKVDEVDRGRQGDRRARSDGPAPDASSHKFEKRGVELPGEPVRATARRSGRDAGVRGAAAAIARLARRDRARSRLSPRPPAGSRGERCANSTPVGRSRASRSARSCCTLPRAARARAGRLAVRENGTAVSERPRCCRRGAAGRGDFGVVLVIDASESMRGAPIDDAIGGRAGVRALSGTPDQQLGDRHVQPRRRRRCCP